ncbi:hypothetical protein [Streptomyces cinnamoneus]|uniref:Uncharacterized protein n=1 Tax=Streptomyces cinnamoneus TaxID=53446 RepID=A0A918TZE8_STRCJ|nr:hypothetical protein [Streptomyces cinnamoneus]GHC68057.1 hypothetical protein GCM10010507_52970 [Streptomyces cinnamoneus]
MTGIDGCLAEAMAIPGARGASLVDWTSGLALGVAGEGPGGDHETSAADAAELARLAFENAAFTRSAAGPGPVEDVIVTARGGYHLIRFVETAFDSSVFLYLWLDRAEANLAVALFRLKALAGRLVVT